MPSDSHTEAATFGAGCFWCVEAVFERLRGVRQVESGYAGGNLAHPTYEQVCSGGTGHAEVVQITFDPAIISYRDLLLVFFTTHDPTTPNRQGVDYGTQYRSVIFYHSLEQKKSAEEVIAQLVQESKGTLQIVTQVLPLASFYRAENYHQGYFRNHPTQGYCQSAIPPKLAKMRKNFAGLLMDPKE